MQQRYFWKFVAAILFVAMSGCSNDNEVSEIAVGEPVILPVADAGHSLIAGQDESVTLNGSKSYDPNGEKLGYQWSLVGKPSGSNTSLVDEDTPFPRLFIDVAGDYTVELVVTTSSGSSDPSSVTVSDSNTTPTADAGPDMSYQGTNKIVRLDGSASSDSDGDTLSYQWELINVPAGSSTTLSKATSPFPFLSPDVAGDFEIRLTVTDLSGNSDSDTVLISETNTKPVANAGADQIFAVGEVKRLNGLGSVDADGDSISYQWAIVSSPAGSSAAISAAESSLAEFVPDIEGTYILSLVVNDGQIDSEVATVALRPDQHIPIADAGSDLTSTLGRLLHLDGTGSQDADGDVLTAQWHVISRPRSSMAILGDANTFHPTLTPDIAGDYVVQLVVSDGAHSSIPDQMIITTNNSKPTADAGPDRSARTGATITLDGSKSTDPDGDPLSYRWSIVSAPPGTQSALSDSTKVAPSFTPDTMGEYVFQLIVSDGVIDSAPSTVRLTDNDLPPTARAGRDQIATLGALIRLDGSLSSDPEQQPLVYQWSLMSAPASSTAQLVDASSSHPKLTPDVAGDYVIQLAVTDASGQKAFDVVVVRETSKNTLPVAHAGQDLRVNTGVEVVLNGSGSSDADGDTLTYRWTLVSQPAGSSASLLNANSGRPKLTPDVEGDFVVQLVVSDGTSTSAPDTVVLHDTDKNIAPIAIASSPLTPQVGDVVQLTGDQSKDPDNDPLTYRWHLDSKPAGSQASISNSTAANPTIIPDEIGFYNLSLEVSDGVYQSKAVTLFVADKPAAGAVVPIPTGHELLMLSTTGGDSGTGSLVAISERDLTKTKEIFSFHGVPSFIRDNPFQSVTAHPTSGLMHVVQSTSGVYGRGSVLQYDPSTEALTLLASIPRLTVSGYEVERALRGLVYHPNGKSAYIMTEKGGEQDAGVIFHFDLDANSSRYKTFSVIAEFGKAQNGFPGAPLAPATELTWTDDEHLFAVWLDGRGSGQRPALELIPSNVNDLSKPWDSNPWGTRTYTRLKGSIAFQNDAFVNVISSFPPVVEQTARAGAGSGTAMTDCYNPLATFFWESPSVFVFCRGGGGFNASIYETNTAAGGPSLERVFSNWGSVAVTGLMPSEITSKMYVAANDELTSFYIGAGGSVDFVALGVQPPFVTEINKPNFSDVPVIQGGRDNGYYFMGNPAVINLPSDNLNDRYISILSYDGGDYAQGALLTYNRGKDAVTSASMGFAISGLPYGRMIKVQDGSYYFSSLSDRNNRFNGSVARYEPTQGTLEALPGVQRLRPGIGHVQAADLKLYGMGVNLFDERYELYSIDTQTNTMAVLKNLSKTKAPVPEFELVADESRLWIMQDSSVSCYDISSGALTSIQLTSAGPHEPVRAITIPTAQADGYFATANSSVNGQGTIQHLKNNCSAPVITGVVAGLTDIPSTAMLYASDGLYYYGTQNGKLMKFDPKTNSVVQAAAVSSLPVAGFLIEDANGDIVGLASNGDVDSDMMFAYTLASGALVKQSVPATSPIDSHYPGFTEIN